MIFIPGRAPGQCSDFGKSPAQATYRQHPLPTLPGRVVNVPDRQRVHIDQGCRFQRLEREISTIAVVVAGLITLEATGVDGCFTTPTGLLRALAKQAAQLSHPELLLPAAERAVVRCLFETEFIENDGRIVEPRFGLAEALVEFDTHQDQRDLHPFEDPAAPACDNGFAWVVNMLFDRSNTLNHKRPFGFHIAR